MRLHLLYRGFRRPLSIVVSACTIALACLNPTTSGADTEAHQFTKPPSPWILDHGHWCGVYNTEGGAPVDSFDAACRAHDLCLKAAPREQKPMARCDAALLQRVSQIRGNYSGEVRLKMELFTQIVSAAQPLRPEV